MGPDTVAQAVIDTPAQAVTDDPSSTTTPIDLWLGATSWCGTTRIGGVCGFVCSALPPRVREVLVRDDDRGHTEHPVALRDIAGGADTRDVAVSLPADEVRARRCATTTVTVDDCGLTLWADLESGMSDEWMLHAKPVHLPVAVPYLADGDVLIRRDTVVRVDQHRIGHLAGLRVDPTSARVLACIVDVGHRWHHRHVLLPADAVERMSELGLWLRGGGRELARSPGPHDLGPGDVTPALPTTSRGPDDDSNRSEGDDMQAATAPTTTEGRGWHRAVIAAAALAVAVEGVVGVVAITRDFGSELWFTITGRASELGAANWVFGWEALQLLAAVSLPFIALLILRGSRPGYFAALILQGVAIGVSGYRVVDTLPDTGWLIAIVAITTILLSLKSVRDWCLGRSDAAFRQLIADHDPEEHPVA